jgi:hypothetical protein
MWTVVDTQNGPRLCAPWTGVHHWLPGVNRTSTYACVHRLHERHPLIDCNCGIRVVQSLAFLQAYATWRHWPLTAYAEVDVWGKVAPPVPDDDWRHTIRAEFARIVGPLHLAPSHTALADALARHYGIEAQS